MPELPPVADPSEPDLFWSGHSGWAILPSIVVGVVASAAFMLGAEYLSEWTILHDEWAAFAAFWVILICWAGMAIVWTYRSAGFVYRLTPKHLFVDFGKVYRPTPPIPLASINEVKCRAWVLRRWFGVGSVMIYSEGRDPLRLRGIFQPERFAEAILKAAGKSNRSCRLGMKKFTTKKPRAQRKRKRSRK